MKNSIRSIIFFTSQFAFMLSMNSINIFAQKNGNDNIPYLSDKDIAAIEMVLPDDPVYIPEIAAENPAIPAPASALVPVQPLNLTINIYITGEKKGITRERVKDSPAPRFLPATVFPKMPDPSSGYVYRVQAGSYVSPLHAQNTLERLRIAGFNPAYERFNGYYRVVLSGVKAADMQYTAQLLGNIGIKEVWIRREY